ncbi:MAG: DCC1-like thiol-disulfide oxidoreductase family protein [Candidatus Bipolaricaulia bacterium]
MATKLLIYDGACGYCRGFARLVRVLDRRKRFALLPYESDAAQELLRAQFGENVGFAMFLFDEDSVSWGREAAQRIVRELRVPGARVAFWLYPALVALVSLLTRRQKRVCGPACTRGDFRARGLPIAPEIKQYIHKLQEYV